MWINRIKWRDGKTNVCDTKTDAEIIKMVYIIPNSKTVDHMPYLIQLREIKYCNLK